MRLGTRSSNSESALPPGRVTASGRRHSVVRAGVLVIGGGNAALCAAITARTRGQDVLLLESASREWRGGNSKYTRNVRCVHDGDHFTPGGYTEEEFETDLIAVTGEGSDLGLTRLMIRHSRDIREWMEGQGVRWQPALTGTLQLSGTNRFFLGGGKALINNYFRMAEQLGVRVAYDSRVVNFHFNGAQCVAADVSTPTGSYLVEPDAVVAASGGFEANLDWLRHHWGNAVDNYSIRGTRNNDGLILKRLFEAGAASRGNPHGFHAIAVDARGPQFDGGIVTRVDSVPFSVVLNRNGARFYDEGEDLWPRRYATWGGLIAHEPGQIAYSIFDRKVAGRFIGSLYPPYRAPSLTALVDQLGLPIDATRRTIANFNAATRAPERYAPGGLDGCATEGIDPPKSNWALPVDDPPFYAYPLRPGITFTYLALGVDHEARVLTEHGGRFANVFAAGEIMAGNVLRRGYLAGVGMTIGTVFGRLAGEGAAQLVVA